MQCSTALSLSGCVAGVVESASSVVPTKEATRFVTTFMGVALVLERLLPGRIERGHETAMGHVPEYVCRSYKPESSRCPRGCSSRNDDRYRVTRLP